MQKPKKWSEVYAQGTKEGTEESKFFKTLARHPQWQYRSIAHLAAETKLPRKRIEEMIAKYSDVKRFNPPLVYAHPTQEDQWGYWERVPEHLEKDKRSVTKKDQDRRVKKHIQGLDYIEIDINNLPDEIKISDEVGCDGACITITNQSGHTITMTDNHPLFSHSGCLFPTPPEATVTWTETVLPINDYTLASWDTYNVVDTDDGGNKIRDLPSLDFNIPMPKIPDISINMDMGDLPPIIFPLPDVGH